jgi:hypothetical protein
MDMGRLLHPEHKISASNFVLGQTEAKGVGRIISEGPVVTSNFLCLRQAAKV